MFALLRRLPRPVKTFLLRASDGLGAWPQRIRAGPARGLIIIAPLNRWLQYSEGKHEVHVTAAIRKLLGPGMVACDVGAHLGYLTLVMARQVGESGRVFSFEPVVRHAEALRRTVARNRLPQVEVVERAVSASCDTVWIEEGPSDAMARMVEDGACAGRFSPVSASTLDAWEESQGGLERLDLIKLDIEGQELEALAGAAEMLRRHRPVVVCEVHWSQQIGYHPRQLVDCFAKAGYEVALIPRPEQPVETLEHVLGRVAAATAPHYMTVFHVLARVSGSA